MKCEVCYGDQLQKAHRTATNERMNEKERKEERKKVRK